MGFETTSARSGDNVIHDNESLRPQKLDKKIKHIFIFKKNFFLGYVFSARRNSNFHEKWVTKIELHNSHLFSSNFEFWKNI